MEYDVFISHASEDKESFSYLGISEILLHNVAANKVIYRISSAPGETHRYAEILGNKIWQ